jgi:hypothetical protein
MDLTRNRLFFSDQSFDLHSIDNHPKWCPRCGHSGVASACGIPKRLRADWEQFGEKGKSRVSVRKSVKFANVRDPIAKESKVLHRAK